MGGQSNFCQIIKSESMDFDLLKDKGTCKPAQNVKNTKLNKCKKCPQFIKS